MVRARVAQDVAHAAAGAGARLPRPQDDGGEAGELDGARAHRAGLEGDDERAAVQVRVPQRGARGPEGADLRVGGRVYSDRKSVV